MRVFSMDERVSVYCPILYDSIHTYALEIDESAYCASSSFHLLSEIFTTLYPWLSNWAMPSVLVFQYSKKNGNAATIFYWPFYDLKKQGDLDFKYFFSFLCKRITLAIKSESRKRKEEKLVSESRPYENGRRGDLAKQFACFSVWGKCFVTSSVPRVSMQFREIRAIWCSPNDVATVG